FVMRPTITLRRNQTALIIGSIALVLVIVIIGIILIGPMNPSLHNSSSPQTILHPPIADNKQVFVSSVVGANTSDITTFDPAQASDSYSTIAVQTVFTGLVSLDDKGNVRGQLATSWEFSPSGLTWTFHLRPNLKFSDGTPLTSNDVAWSIDRALRKDTNSFTAPYYLRYIKASDKLNSGAISSII